MGIYCRKGIWYVDYYYNGLRKREAVGAEKKIAELALKKRKIEMAENRFLNIKREAKVTFREFAEKYIEVYAKPNKKSWISDFYNIKTLNRYFGDRYLFSIDRALIERFKAQRIAEVKPATANREMATLKIIFTKAIDWGFIEDAPTKRISFFKENNARVRFLTKAEIDRLLSNCSGYLKDAIVIVLNTGLRRSELFNMKWEYIDFDRGLITIPETKNGHPKILPMNNEVRAVLLRRKVDTISDYVITDNNNNTLYNIMKIVI